MRIHESEEGESDLNIHARNKNYSFIIYKSLYPSPMYNYCCDKQEFESGNRFLSQDVFVFSDFFFFSLCTVGTRVVYEQVSL